ncbi:MAG: prephenate dehydrogenase/arogenate dehydrogenase family protein [Thermoanaerobaculia bacterium]|nr:prephenate dehydrogenase/arogenate dehydrogenase family protein [Thermoanaerobaculia bacterium]
MPKPKHHTKRTGPRRRTVLLVGGAGRMGRLFARFFRRRGYAVRIADPAGVQRGFAKGTLEDAARADVVVIAASLENAAAALGAVLERRPEGLVFDIASLKAPLLPLFARARREGIAIASVHPMFGPDASLSGRDFLVCDAGDAPAARRVARLFAGEGMKIRTMPAEDHDRWVGRTMGLAHVAALACAGALERLKVDAFDVDGRATTSFRRLLDLVGSLLDQEPALTRAIQTQNPDAPWVAEVLSEEVEAFRAAIFAPDLEPLAARVMAVRRALGRR